MPYVPSAISQSHFQSTPLVLPHIGRVCGGASRGPAARCPPDHQPPVSVLPMPRHRPLRPICPLREPGRQNPVRACCRPDSPVPPVSSFSKYRLPFPGSALALRDRRREGRAEPRAIRSSIPSPHPQNETSIPPRFPFRRLEHPRYSSSRFRRFTEFLPPP